MSDFYTFLKNNLFHVLWETENKRTPTPKLKKNKKKLQSHQKWVVLVFVFSIRGLVSDYWLIRYFDWLLAWILSQTVQLKQCHEPQQKPKEFSSPSSSASSAMETQSLAPPPQPPPKESLSQRYKFLWPMHLAVNVVVGSPFPFLIP